MATSAASVERAVLPSPSALVAASVPPPPKPPATMFGIERFMASAIRLVRIVPEAPTMMPPTISAVLSSAMPAAAADRPVSAFSSEITTGMSAPPIGSTTMLPSIAAATRIRMNRPSRLRAGGDRDARRRRRPAAARG